MDRPTPTLPQDLPPGWDAGWGATWRDQVAQGVVAGGMVPARVVRIDKGGITAATDPTDERLVVAAKTARRVVVGDVVALDAAAGRIEAILPRRTVFERRSPGVGRDEIRLESRPVAANMDRVLVLQPLDPGLNPQRLARELVLAWESGATPVVLLTKADLVDAAAVAVQVEEARRWAPGVQVHAVSTRRDHGADALRDITGEGHVLALLGSSGAGKSSLANLLAGTKVQLVAEVRDNDRRGRHTTSAGQMIRLSDGALLIDTPGIRGVGLWAADDGLERAFADLAPYADDCRFVDCTHRTEPGCGILAAVAAGQIGADRLAVWHDLVDELESLEADLEERDRQVVRQVNQASRHRARGRGPGTDS